MIWDHVRALLATARVANVPSVVSNVWVGGVAASLLQLGGDSGESIADVGSDVWWLVVAGVCLYVAGNFLNDWYDRDWDAERRPERALPSGLFCPSSYLLVALGLLVMAGVCAWALNAVALVVAGVILIFVVVYTVMHKRTGWGVVWVGLCRALLVVLGVVGTVGQEHLKSWDSLVLVLAVMFSIPLFFYIMGLSVSARFEAKGEVPKWATRLSLGMLALPMVIVWVGLMVQLRELVIFWAVIPYVMWMVVCYVRRSQIPRYVSGLLAGIPLVDLMVLGANAVYVARYGHEVSPNAYLVPLIAFGTGLLLQRVAPAS